MALRLFNTMSATVEEFRPSHDNTVRMYACGPTVYDYGHIGNFRTFVALDILRRFLEQSGFGLLHVMNITDVDDRIIENSARLGKSVREYTEQYERAFDQDAELLNLQHPELIVRATEHMAEMARLIASLVEHGFAYRTDDGSYYFRIAKFPQYGKLSKKDLTAIEDGARVDSDRFDKEEARDFALWKAPKPGEAFWETQIGPGRPGWHIECSAMSMKYLGETFDLHAGGEDLIFPHHENEIAQSEAVTGKPLARFWFHVRFLLVEGEKMSKSLNNFYTLRDLVMMGHKPSSIRFLLASVPYRRQLNFTFDGLKQAASSVERLRNFKLRLQTAHLASGSHQEMARLADETALAMHAALEDDLNTAEFLGAVFEMVRQVNAAADAGELKQQDVPALLGLLETFDRIFAVMHDDDAQKMRHVLEWAKAQGKQEKIAAQAEVLAQSAGISDAEVEKRVAEHDAARQARDFAKSDEIRNQLAEAGIILENTKDGVRWRRK
jgi:cysteinyl-tRNA synthetase